MELVLHREALLKTINPGGNEQFGGLLGALIDTCYDEMEMESRHYFTCGVVAGLREENSFDV